MSGAGCQVAGGDNHSPLVGESTSRRLVGGGYWFVYHERRLLAVDPMVDFFDLDNLLAQLILALGAALVVGNAYALVMARRGVKPKGADGELRRGRAWFLLGVGLVIAVWGAASLIAR